MFLLQTKPNISISAINFRTNVENFPEIKHMHCIYLQVLYQCGVIGAFRQVYFQSIDDAKRNYSISNIGIYEILNLPCDFKWILNAFQS